MRSSILRQIYLTYIFITIIPIGLITLYAVFTVQDFYFSETESKLIETATALKNIFSLDYLKDEDKANIFCKNVALETNLRITIILPDGKVIGDSHEEPYLMNSHSDREEIQAALSGAIGVSARFSVTLSKRLMYIALPLMSNGNIEGVLRVAMPLELLNNKVFEIYSRIIPAVLIILLITGLTGFLLAGKINQPLAIIQQAAKLFASGELDHRVDIDKPEEVRLVGQAMNKMAEQLNARILTVTSQKNELDTILDSMVEAVIFLDRDMIVKEINPAASKLFQIDEEEAKNKSILEIVRNTKLHAFTEKIKRSNKALEENIILYKNPPVYLQVHGTKISHPVSEKHGILLVFNDISRLKQLENIRKDFVSNVSHELKTPVTMIKGFIETIMEDGFKDKKKTDNFLNIILKHTDRLNAIIEDLLSLSWIEQIEPASIAFEECRLDDIIRSAVQVYEKMANDRRISIHIICPEQLKANVNKNLLEQAVNNLVENAIKYNIDGGSVEISAKRGDRKIVISVKDTGCGIPQDDLPRIFERFYRVDKARSRALGGTGLGLAIVKHIALVHDGEVTVQSETGKGSVFSIILPERRRGE